MGLAETLLDKLPRPRGDKYIWLCVLILMTVSVIEVFSASSRLTFDKSYLHPIFTHVIHLGIGLVVMYIVHNIHYKRYKYIPIILVPLSIALLAYLSWKGRGVSGAQRWIPLKFFQLQPSELAKLAVILSVAFWLSRLNRDDWESQTRTFRRITVLTGIVCLLIFGENLSTAIILGMVVLVMMMIGGIAWKKLLILTSSIVLAGTVAVILFVTVPPSVLHDSKLVPSRATTWQARILDFTDHDKASRTPLQYVREVAPEKPQETHANIAIATSGLVGKMPGNSRQRDYLQEASCDFIYAIIIEELGLVGAVGVMVVYLFLLYRVGRIASRAKKRYPSYLAVGLGLLLGLQAFVNMSVAVGLFPVTGQPLPLISKGGTSVLVTSICIGMLLGISGSLDEEESQALAEESMLPEVLKENENVDNRL